MNDHRVYRYKTHAITLTIDNLNEIFGGVRFSDSRSNIFYQFYLYTMTRNA